MKRMFLGITVAAALLAAAFPLTASAQGASYKGGALPSLDFVVYNSTVAAADAAINTGVIDTSGAESLTIHLTNAGSGARTVYVECWEPNGLATTHRFAAVSAGATDNAVVWIDPRATGTAPAKFTFWPVVPCHKTSVSAAAATGTMRVVMLKRTGR